MDFLALLKQALLAISDLIANWNRYLTVHFGRPVQLAVDWVLLGLLIVMALRLLRMTTDILRYVLLPSILIAALVSAFTNFTFFYVLPFPMGVGTIALLYKS